MVFKTEKWIVCFWVNHEPTFDRFDNKEDVLSFIDESLDDPEKSSILNDYIVFPPASDLTEDEILLHGVPERFKPKKR